MTKNKKADLPIIVLVIGVVGICILTILSFVKFNGEIDEDFLGIGLIETMNSIDEELDLINSPGNEFKLDYNKKFISVDGKVVIEIDGNKVINGSYAIDECFYWIFSCNDKRKVLIEYP